MGRRDAYLEYLEQVPLFSACSKQELNRLARRGTPIPVQEGQALAKEGESGHEFFIIVDGRAKVSRRGRKVAELDKGAFFGELSLLINRPRNATVTALTPMEVFVLDRREFKAALEDAPRLANKLLVGLANRLWEADQRL